MTAATGLGLSGLGLTTGAEISGPVIGAGFGLVAVADTQDGGGYYLADYLAIAGTPDIPLSRRVRLMMRNNGRVIRETWSDPVTGYWWFDRIAYGPYTVLAIDDANNYNAVVADNQVGVPL